MWWMMSALDAKCHGAADDPLRRRRADGCCSRCDLDAGLRGQVGVAPTLPQLSLDRVAQVTDESPSPDQNAETHLEIDDAMEEAQRAMEDARARLAEVPAEVVVTNHVMGLYELAAIHLSASPPDLVQSALAIDAVACLVDGLGDRLGEEATTMRDALNNIRMAFVQIKGTLTAPVTDPDD